MMPRFPFDYYFANLKYDVPAGISVFLVAVPLSLGIALASGAPLISGLLTGIVGGVLVAPLSGSALGISGAAAGLAMMVAEAVADLGFDVFLSAMVIAGLLQLLMGWLNAGVIAYYFPSSVINGMLTGIGVILFLKQIPHAVGYDHDYEGDLAFNHPDHETLIGELSRMLDSAAPGALLISAVSLAVLIIWELPLVKNRRPPAGWLQSSIVAIVVGALINYALGLYAPALALKDGHLVSIPIGDGPFDLGRHLHFPDFSRLDQAAVYLTAVSLALIGSVQTLVIVEAVDKMDRYGRVTSTRRELFAQGVGNICAALLGGIPLTQVIVRSSINVQAGARTKVSAVVHGLLLLAAVLLMPALLNRIPLASVACVLLAAALKLIKPSVFKAMYRAGLYHFVPFCATMLGVVFKDMTTGIGLGLAVASVSILLESYKTPFYFRKSQIGNKIIFKLAEHVSFLNKAHIKKTLDAIPKLSEVVIDATRSNYIDYDVYEIIQEFSKEAAFKNIRLTLENLRGFGTLAPIAYARPPDHQDQQSLTPVQVLALLKEGNERFVNNLESNRNLLEQVNDTRQGQFPIAIILSCMDSRTSAELIFDLGLGEIFSVRIAGNIINGDILGCMEYACQLAGSKLIVVLGHSRCGAINGACADVKLDHLTGLLNKIKPLVDAVRTDSATCHLTAQALTEKVAEKNVYYSVADIRRQSPLLANLEKAGRIGMVGGMYHIETGKVEFYPDLATPPGVTPLIRS